MNVIPADPEAEKSFFVLVCRDAININQLVLISARVEKQLNAVIGTKPI